MVATDRPLAGKSAAAQDMGKWLLPPLVAVLCGLLAHASMTITSAEKSFAAVWAGNAIIVAILLCRPTDAIAKWAGPAWVANCVANVLHGNSAAIAAVFATANLVECVVAIWALRRLGCQRPDFFRLRDLARFVLVAAIIAPIFSSSIAVTAIQPHSVKAALDAMFRWWATDALGMILIAPILLILHQARRNMVQTIHGKSRDWIIVFLIGTGVTVSVFSQERLPLLFLVLPVVLVHAFRLGALGTAFSIFKISIIASVATGLGHGPVHLINDFDSQLLVLQLFLATGFFVGLPVAIMLEERASALDDLSTTQALYSSLLENMHEVFFRVDADARWEFLNPAWTTLTGFTREHSLGGALRDMLQPQDRANFETNFGKLRDGSAGDHACRVQVGTTSGEWRVVELHLTTVHDVVGHFAGAVGTMRDVTEQAAAETALQQKERDFETMAAIAPVGIVRTRQDGAVTYCNPAWLKLAGLNLEEAREGGWANALDLQDRERVWTEWHDAVAQRRGYRTEFRFRGNQTPIWVDVIAEPEFDASGNVSGFVAIVVDITDRKALQDALIRARKHAEAAALSKSSFLANMSHEIRTPMNGVLGFADLLLECELDEEARHCAETIVDSGKEMMRLLNDILDLSKIEAGELTILDEEIDIQTLLANCVKLVSPQADTKQLHLSLDVSPEVMVPFRGDGGRLRQIVLNLLGNAVKFTEEGAVSVCARCRIVDDVCYLEVEVIDTGIGIPDSKRASIFEPFAQADSSTSRHFGGTGLGLTICLQLARKMGGDIRFDSAPGRGSSFRLWLPLKKSQVARSVEGQLIGADHSAAPNAGRPLRILLAEDILINQKLVQKILARTGYDLTIVENGQDAIAQVNVAAAGGGPYDLVLMDIQMPGTDGLEACRAIRATGHEPADLPIIALTANAFPEDIERCVAAGMQDHIEKPINKAALLKTIQTWRRQAIQTSQVDGSDGASQNGSDLLELYLQRKLAVLAELQRLAREADGSKCNAHLLRAECHKLAGVAGLFGDGDLGALAAKLDGRLKTMSDGAECDRLKRFAARLTARLSRAA